MTHVFTFPLAPLPTLLEPHLVLNYCDLEPSGYCYIEVTVYQKKDYSLVCAHPNAILLKETQSINYSKGLYLFKHVRYISETQAKVFTLC